MNLREEMLKSFVVKIADGNIGAATCCMEILGTTNEKSNHSSSKSL